MDDRKGNNRYPDKEGDHQKQAFDYVKFHGSLSGGFLFIINLHDGERQENFW
jgi:hypothetical protein